MYMYIYIYCLHILLKGPRTAIPTIMSKANTQILASKYFPLRGTRTLRRMAEFSTGEGKRQDDEPETFCASK